MPTQGFSRMRPRFESLGPLRSTRDDEKRKSECMDAELKTGGMARMPVALTEDTKRNTPRDSIEGKQVDAPSDVLVLKK